MPSLVTRLFVACLAVSCIAATAANDSREEARENLRAKVLPELGANLFLATNCEFDTKQLDEDVRTMIAYLSRSESDAQSLQDVYEAERKGVGPLAKSRRESLGITGRLAMAMCPAAYRKPLDERMQAWRTNFQRDTAQVKSRVTDEATDSMQGWAECFKRVFPTLDDRISDVATISKSANAECKKDHDRLRAVLRLISRMPAFGSEANKQVFGVELVKDPDAFLRELSNRGGIAIRRAY